MFDGLRIRWHAKIMRQGKTPARMRAIEKLARIDDPRTVDVLLNALKKSSTPREGQLLAQALATRSGAALVPDLIRVAQDGRVLSRIAAIEALGKIGDCRALEPLLSQLVDPDAQVRTVTAAALARLGEPQWQELVKGSNEDLPRLAEHPDIRILGLLLKAQNHAERPFVDKPVRTWSKVAVAAMLQPQFVEWLKNSAAGAEPQLQETAKQTLISFDLDPPQERAWRFFRDRRWSDLASLKDAAIIPALAGARDPDPLVRAECVKVLAQFDQPATIAALMEALDDPDGQVVTEAAKGLVPRADPAVKDRLAAARQSAMIRSMSGELLYDEGGYTLRSACLKSRKLMGADLRGRDLRRAYLYAADLAKADLSGASLSRAILIQARFTGANLRRANLSEVAAASSNFWHGAVSFTGADLSGAVLDGGYFGYASFVGAKLCAVSFRKADLYAVNFADADLTDADFTDANCEAAQFSFAKNVDRARGLTRLGSLGSERT